MNLEMCVSVYPKRFYPRRLGSLVRGANRDFPQTRLGYRVIIITDHHRSSRGCAVVEAREKRGIKATQSTLTKPEVHNQSARAREGVTKGARGIKITSSTNRVVRRVQTLPLICLANPAGRGEIQQKSETGSLVAACVK